MLGPPAGRSALARDVFGQERLERSARRRPTTTGKPLYQQNPQAEGSAEWPDSFFGPDIWFNEWPDDWACKTVALDPSKGTDVEVRRLLGLRAC